MGILDHRGSEVIRHIVEPLPNGLPASYRQVNEWLQRRIDTTSVANRVFYGFAEPSSATSSSVWKIYVIDTEPNGQEFRQFAQLDGKENSGFVHEWDERVNLFPNVTTAALGDRNEFSTDFDGTNDFARAGSFHRFETVDPFSFGIWLKPQSFSSAQFYISNVTAAIQGYRFGSDTSGNVTVELIATNTRTHTFNTVLSAGNWQFLTFTYDGSANINGLRLYLNSVIDSNLPASGVLIGDFFPAVSDFIIGQSDLANYYFGRVDEVSVWDKELSQFEVSELYNNGQHINLNDHSAFANLVSWYRMGDGDTFPLIADNISSINLTMNNMTADDFVEDVGTTPI